MRTLRPKSRLPRHKAKYDWDETMKRLRKAKSMKREKGEKDG